MAIGKRLWAVYRHGQMIDGETAVRLLTRIYFKPMVKLKNHNSNCPKSGPLVVKLDEEVIAAFSLESVDVVFFVSSFPCFLILRFN